MSVRKEIPKRPNCTSVHMFLNGKKMEKFTACNFSRSTTVEILYAHNNLLINVDNLSSLQNLTHVYLQWNRINSIKNFGNLPCLQNLYLGFNCISMVEGLKGMPNLKLLHVQKQKFSSEGITLEFDAESLENISVRSLTSLNVAGNHLISLNKLRCLFELEHLNMSDNMLADKEETCSVLSQWRHLQNLDIQENPMMWTSGKVKYHIISLCKNLEVLNSKPIPRSTRSFLRALGRVQNLREKLEGRKKYAQFHPETRSSSNRKPEEIREIVSRSVTLRRREDNVEKC